MAGQLGPSDSECHLSRKILYSLRQIRCLQNALQIARKCAADSRVELTGNALSNSANLFFARLRFELDRGVCLTYIRSMKRVSLFLSDSQIAALKKLARRTGIKMSELIRRFIDEGLKRS